MSRSPAWSLAALLAASIAPPALAAPSKAACVDAHGDGQAQRKAGKLLAARERFLVCADEACPAVVRKECLAWAQEVDADATSFVVEATVEGAGDTTDVVVALDGQVIAKRLDGRAIVADPGPHTLRFETPGATAVEQSVTLRAGEKNRKLSVTFRRPSAAPSAPAPASVAPPPPAPVTVEAPKPTRSSLPYVLAGVGVVGLAGFAYFGLDASKKKSELDDRGCKPGCPQGDVDAVKRGYLFANVSLGVGLVGLGVATVMLVGRSKSERATLVVSPTRDGAAAGVVGAF